jgi:hypothetical protein
MSERALRAPGTDERFTVRTLRLDEVDHWYRIYPVTGRSVGMGPLSFNLGWGRSRFAPIHLSGSAAHTYYAASTLDCALLESVLHDIDLDHPSFFDLTLLKNYRVAKLRMHGSIQYVSFHSHDLPRLGLSRRQLIEALPEDHGLTRAWAQAALEQRAAAQAIGYTSRRNDAGRCLMLVGQRLPLPPFEIIDDASLGAAGRLRSNTLELIASLGISTL